jgi:hypothetical protein
LQDIGGREEGSWRVAGHRLGGGEPVEKGRVVGGGKLWEDLWEG